MAELIFEVQDLELLEGELVLTQIHRWLSDTNNTRGLLIFDNYDDPDGFKIDASYPPTCHGSVIITTRRPALVAGTKLAVQPLRTRRSSYRVKRVTPIVTCFC